MDRHDTPATVDTFAADFPTPSGIVSGRFLWSDDCLVFALEPRAERYRPILPPGSRLVTDTAGQPAAVVVGGDRIAIGATVRAGGGVGPWAGAAPRARCPADTIFIGKILAGG